MKLDDLVYLVKAGYNKEEITAFLKDDPAAKTGGTGPKDDPAAKTGGTGPKDDPAAKTGGTSSGTSSGTGLSEVDFLRKQVQDLQALNLLYASGKTPAQPESEQDIMRLLMNGKE